MFKLKKRLTVIVSVFLVFAVLGSTAAIFVGTRTNNNGQEVITSPVGYLDGTVRGTGDYVSDPSTWVFAENDPSVFLKGYDRNEPLFDKGKLGLVGEYAGNTAMECVANLVADTDGNGYVELTNADTGTGAAVLITEISNGHSEYDKREGTYAVEFDFMVPKEVPLNKNGGTDKWFMSFSLTETVTSDSEFSRIFLHDSSVDGYYTIGNTENTARIDESVLFKYGEWYCFRFEYKLDNSSTNYDCNVIVNDVDICSFNTRYWTKNGFGEYTQYGPRYFRFITRGYANGLKVCVDNLYFGKK